MTGRCFCAALACVLFAGCSDRARPGPLDIPITVDLAVDVVAPRSSSLVVAGRIVSVLVHASEPSARLTGVAFVARRFDNNAIIDSMRISFAARQDTSHQFQLHVPPTLPTNAQIDLYGIAYGSNLQSRVSTPRAILVLNCQPSTNC